MMFSFTILLLLGYIIYKYFRKVQRYWDEKNIPNTKAWPIVGDMAPMILKTSSMADHIMKVYNMFPNERYFGMWQFTKPVLAIKDLDVLKQISIKDFDHFEDHQGFVSSDGDPFVARNLFGLKGQEWRQMRATLSPAFTSAKMRAMFLLMCETAEGFVQYYLKQGKETVTLEMKDTFTRYASDIIASTAFGIKCNSMAEPKNEFFLMGKNATDITGLRALQFLLVTIAPKLMKFLNIGIFPNQVYTFFRRIVKETLEIREKENIFRPDMIHLLMQARKGKLKHETRPEDDEGAGFATVQESNVSYDGMKIKQDLSNDDITAQAFIFFLAGFETTSTALCFMSHELAVNSEIQKKLQQEIDETLKFCNGKLTYEALLNMKYLDMVFSETLRRWHPAVMSDRLCTKPYTIQPKNPGEQPFHLKKGDAILIPFTGIHMDPKYYPNPEKFDPERFSDENKSNIVPGSYIPFGIGPRNCIGSRFAILENKVLFVHILSKFEIVVVEETQVPLRLSRKKAGLTAENGFWLGFKPR